MNSIKANKPYKIALNYWTAELKATILSCMLLLCCYSIIAQSSHKSAVPQKATNNGVRKDLLPPEIVSLNFLKNSKGEIIKNKNGKPFLLGDGGVAHFTNYTSDNGLALDGVLSSCVDHLGNIWFGTYGGGVSRYDGKSFTNYSVPNGLAFNEVLSILEDSKGNMWFGTGNGLSLFDGKSFTTYTTKQGLPDNNVRCIIQDKAGKIWAGTEKGMWCYNGEEVKSYDKINGLSNTHIYSLCEDNNNNLWIGTQNGVYKFDGKEFVNYTVKDGLPNNFVFKIIKDKQGNIWVGTYNGLSFCSQNFISKKNIQFKNYSSADGLAANIVTKLFQDSNGNIWVGSYSGISCITNYSDSLSVKVYTKSEGLANNSVTDIVEDLEGNIWISTNGGGVSCFHGMACSNFTQLNTAVSSANTIWSIAEDNNQNLWFATFTGGASYFDGYAFNIYNMQNGMPNISVWSVYKDRKDEIWLGIEHLISCFKRNKPNEKPYLLNYNVSANTIVRGISQDNNGNFWFGTNKGLIIFDGQNFKEYTSKQGLIGNSTRHVFTDSKGNLWLSMDEGVSMCRAENISASNILFTNYTTKDGLLNKSVWNITEDNSGAIWFATDAGISRFDGKSFIGFNKINGLPDDFTTQLLLSPSPDYLKDKTNHLFIGTNNGAAVLTGWRDAAGNYFPGIFPGTGREKTKTILSNQLLKNYTPVFDIYNTSTGYPIKDVNVGQNTMYRDSKGIIWMATGSNKTALVRFDYNKTRKSLKPLNVIIQNVRIQNEKLSWYSLYGYKNNLSKAEQDSLAIQNEELLLFNKSLTDEERKSKDTKYQNVQFDSIERFYSIPLNLELPYAHNYISIDFTAIQPSRSYMVKYQYILEGYDKEWSPPSGKNSVSYGNIYEGTYTFKVKAQNPDGVWSEPTIYSFKVLPPWYRTWYMYMSYLLVLFALVLIITRWNTRRLREQANKLALEVKKATTEIAQQKLIVEEKNKDILDSIHYAKRIQSALLREEEHISQHLPEHFILFMPKDVVSGDFYWNFEKKTESPNSTVVSKYWYGCAADCTGHGVPGAMMSMLGIGLLNEIASHANLYTPAEVLNELRNKIVRELGQTGKSGENKDGMDISLFRINLQTKELIWAGANNPLYILRNNTLTKFKADKQPVAHHTVMQPFTDNIFNLQEDDILYMFSDGYADQFGGPNLKKFKSKQFEELLISISDKPLKEQKEHLKQTFNNWKANLEQTDDVLVVGVKF